MNEKKTEAIVLQPGDELMTVHMGFIAVGNVADFDAVRKFIQSRKTITYVTGSMSGKDKLWLVKDKEFEALKTIEKRNRAGGEKPA
jgi:hypothetical protein